MLVLQGPWISYLLIHTQPFFMYYYNLDKLTNFLLRVITNNKNQYISILIIIT